MTFPEGNLLSVDILSELKINYLGNQVNLKIGQICRGVPLRLVARQSTALLGGFTVKSFSLPSAPDLMCPHVERSFAKSSLQ